MKIWGGSWNNFSSSSPSPGLLKIFLDENFFEKFLKIFLKFFFLKIFFLKFFFLNFFFKFFFWNFFWKNFFEFFFWKFFGWNFFWPLPSKGRGRGEGGKVGDGVREVTGVAGVTGVTVVTGVVRLTRGRYPPSDLECLSRQDSENIAHC